MNQLKFVPIEWGVNHRNNIQRHLLYKRIYVMAMSHLNTLPMDYLIIVDAIGITRTMEQYGLMESRYGSPKMVTEKVKEAYESVFPSVKNIEYTASEIERSELGFFVKMPKIKFGLVSDSTKTYIIFNPKSGLYKIGRTNMSLDVRAAEIRTSESCSIILVASLNDDREKEIHIGLVDKWVKGEWFLLNNADVDFIIKRYGFKIHNIPVNINPDHRGNFKNRESNKCLIK